MPPAHIGADLFCHFRSPRRGSGNPELSTNPVWVWAIEHGLTGWHTNIAFGGPRSEDAGPCWSFDRYGRTETKLPDGRLIRIGGEYEDWYDADFYIYNDVIVTDGTGGTEIFGYSEDAFPPTDFHTATLVDDRIILIGNLSYPQLRREEAQLFALDTSSYSFERIDAAGDAPPWLYKHTAELIDNGQAILVRGGTVVNRRLSRSVENIDDWRFDLDSSRWERLTRRPWPRFAFVRADGKKNHLYWLRQLLRDSARHRRRAVTNNRPDPLGDLGAEPRLDLLGTLYAPDMPHAVAPARQDDHRVQRLIVEGINVRYAENDREVTLTIEGRLPHDVVERLRADMLEKLATIENTGINCIPLTVD
ncbi:MAG: hypothetical protein JWL86_4454 [Rhizobium sp.]|nr:hypothetical protein [Rhizobium sp.]